MADSTSRRTSEQSTAMRSCIRTGCRWPAVATLSYRYATAEVWLSDLGERHPATHDLCPHHADTMRVPRGWTMVDDRQPVEAVHEPSAAEIVERVTRLRESVDVMLEQPTPPTTARSRYADLLDNLPTYDPDEVDGDDHDRAPSADDDREVDLTSSALVPVGVAHELAPIAREHRGGARGPERQDADDVHETGLRGATVVQLPLRTEDGEDA